MYGLPNIMLAAAAAAAAKGLLECEPPKREAGKLKALLRLLLAAATPFWLDVAEEELSAELELFLAELALEFKAELFERPLVLA